MKQSNSLRKQENKGLSLTAHSHHLHKYETKGDHLICSVCGKSKLNLRRETEGILVGKKSNGVKYTVREDRKRYFFPQEWKQFNKTVKKDIHKFYFFTLLCSGARGMEALNLKVGDIDLERNLITFRVVKHRAAKKNSHSIGKKRTFFVCSNYIKLARKFLKGKAAKDHIFLSNLPPDYDELSNAFKKQYYKSKQVAYSQAFKRYLIKAKIDKPHEFSLHNVRKTYGNWMRIYQLGIEEICYRLGHDFNTYLAHYGSPMIFNQQDKQGIMNIYGDVK